MKIRIIHSRRNSFDREYELDRQTLDEAGGETINSENIIESLKAWTLAPGDTIKIVEVS